MNSGVSKSYRVATSSNRIYSEYATFIDFSLDFFLSLEYNIVTMIENAKQKRSNGKL